jgi:hypothetical protein
VVLNKHSYITQFFVKNKINQLFIYGTTLLPL